jgi:hypothetical protein
MRTTRPMMVSIKRFFMSSNVSDTGFLPVTAYGKAPGREAVIPFMARENPRGPRASPHFCMLTRYKKIIKMNSTILRERSR